jgi:hypothetical protein
MLEGSRAFDIIWGTVAGGACFAVGLTVLFAWVAQRRANAASIFGARIDPGSGLQLAWGIFAMAMGGTNVGCRYVDHHYLSGVHEGFFALTLLVMIVLVPNLPIVRHALKTRLPAQGRRTPT